MGIKINKVLVIQMQPKNLAKKLFKLASLCFYLIATTFLSTFPNHLLSVSLFCGSHCSRILSVWFAFVFPTVQSSAPLCRGISVLCLHFKWKSLRFVSLSELRYLLLCVRGYIPYLSAKVHFNHFRFVLMSLVQCPHPSHSSSRVCGVRKYRERLLLTLPRYVLPYPRTWPKDNTCAKYRYFPARPMCIHLTLEKKQQFWELKATRPSVNAFSNIPMYLA